MKKRLIISLSVVLLALVWYGFFATDWRSSETAPLTVTVEKGDVLEQVTATGTLQPSGYVDVGAQVSGQLKVIAVEVGDKVEQDQLLAEIDPTVYVAQVDASRAQLRSQRAQLQDRQAQLTLAKLQHTRQQNLLRANATAKENVQSAEASLRSAQAQVAALTAQIAQTESSLRADEANLSYAKVVAPMAGTVVQIEARQGQTLNASQQSPVLMRIADLAVMTVEAKVSEADITKLKPGMEVYFTTLGDAKRRWHSQLRKIEPMPEVENNVVLYKALFDIENPHGRLMSQMTTQVFFVIAQAKDTLLVPISALTFNDASDRSQATVTVVNSKQQTETRSVTVGVTNRIHGAITSGLTAGETLLLPTASAQGPSNRIGRRMRL
ncbi:efflux RND transporter periplasmic adaptor subunit [Oceanisphaera avium]|uniref:Efflux transporter periplasmic adaptor subunit n=1 Tax=Oceanisphaera avium TaxID=1903694 RepID=A0A1Y0CZI4_9GAMM|nr:efflux RND transporter periplasmic adaptor subunit [Oceanisphaera avium]ART80731.1 efflux transporter periplasmic adaptor subunit [Oceanisphaera avium]